MTAITFALAVAAVSLAGCGGGTPGTPMGVTNPGQLRDNTPKVLEVSTPGEAVIEHEKAVMDYSNISEGYFCVRSKISSTKVKVLVTVNATGNQYQYTIYNTDQFIVIPLSEGNGSYSVGIWENLTGDEYMAIFGQELNVTLRDQLKPFLYPNQYVNFAAGDSSTQLAVQAATGATSEIEAINGIYTWVIKNVTYDEEKMLTVASGYLPNNAHTISAKKGICFDYAVLTVSMLRGQGVAAKLVIGYAGAAYHAWIEVYSVESGKVFTYVLVGNQWQREMDPTFDAARQGTRDLSGAIGNGSNYVPIQYY